MRQFVAVCLVLVCWALVAQPLGAQQGQQDEKAMMEAYMKLAAPSEHHAHLKALAGKWQVAVKNRMSPEMPWTESKGQGDSEFILGGRFLTQRFKGEPMMGMPQAFEGSGSWATTTRRSTTSRCGWTTWVP